jgi:Spy/CpxP family protein refolding chaperone
MHRLAMLVGTVTFGLALLVGIDATADAQKENDHKKVETKIKGAVPKGWTKTLKLTNDQAAKIRQIDFEYKTKIADLDKKIEDLKQQSRIEMTKQLDADQKAILAKSVGLDEKKSPDK